MRLDGEWRDVQLQRLGDGPRHVLIVDNRLIEVLITEAPQAFHVQIAGHSFEVETGRRRAGARREDADQFVDGRWTLRAPLTGIVVEVRAAEGDVVSQGATLMVVEAMKMLNELKARVPGTVSAVHAQAGERVEVGKLLLEIIDQA